VANTPQDIFELLDWSDELEWGVEIDWRQVIHDLHALNKNLTSWTISQWIESDDSENPTKEVGSPSFPENDQVEAQHSSVTFFRTGTHSLLN
jgi:hypothetical protein